jgi:hypothetical protein
VIPLVQCKAIARRWKRPAHALPGRACS